MARTLLTSIAWSAGDKDVVLKHELRLPVSENPMKRMPIPSLLLAAALAVLVPLEQAHCMWMGLEKHAAPVATAAHTGHECCDSPASPATDHHEQPAGTSHGCLCELLPAAALPPAIIAAPHTPSATPIAVVSVSLGLAPASIDTEAASALDIGSPPPLDDPGAHGLRAPPVSA